MTTSWLVLGLGALLGVGVPWLGMRMVAPSLAEGRVVENYRGRSVFLGLGVAWLLWAGCAILGGVISASLQPERSLSVLPVLTLAGPLALVAFALGLVDDALGTGSARGFRGHLTALVKGRLTTGGMKLLGISLACLFVAGVLAQIAPWSAFIPATARPLRLLMAVPAGAAIALTSNFVNLTDLRPGRALKVYTVLGALGVLCTGLVLPGAFASTDPTMTPAGGFVRVADILVLVMFVFGPVIAVYRYDLGEVGMLGDAGANPMGAVAGMFIVAGLSVWGLIVYLAVMSALNLASERVSFSRVIESNALLKRLDRLGRDLEAREPAVDAKSGPPEGPNAE